MALPIQTTVSDVNTWTDFLRTKMNGATITEAESIIGQQVIDGRKLSGLQSWGLISKRGDHITLTPTGWDYARANSSAKASILLGVIAKIAPYRAILEWAHFQRIDQLTTVDVGSRWVQFHKTDVETENETTLNNNAVCFFHVAQGGGLGKLLIGRRGQPTRLELDRTALASFVEAQPPPLRSASEQVEIAPSGPAGRQELVPSITEAPGIGAEPPLSTVGTAKTQSVEQVFIGHGKNAKILEQVKTILAFGKFEPVIAEEEETTAIPVPEKVMEAMHRCQAAIMNISAEQQVTTDAGEEHFAINDNVLIEVGAAFVLYKKNVVLLADSRVELPSNLQGLYVCRYHGDSLDFDSTMKLQQTLMKFRE